MRALLSFLLMWTAGAQAGVIGVGNSGDMSFQLEFAKASAITILKEVDEAKLGSVISRQDEVDFYRALRQTMYLGALKTQFELVDTIPDGDGYHALARRRPGGIIQISRREMERLARFNTLTGTALIGVVLHEVGHDGVYQGRPVDDSFDNLLNTLGADLIAAANQASAQHFIDLDFIQRVQSGSAVRFDELSGAVKRKLVNKYLDYIGDWIYLQNRERFQDRPAPGSDFAADLTTSWFNGWALQPQSNATPQLREMVHGVLKGSYEMDSFFVQEGPRRLILPSQLKCVDNRTDPASVSCEVQVLWTPLKSGYAQVKPSIQFRLNLFSELQILRAGLNP